MLQELIAKVTVVESPAFTASYPAKSPCRIRLVLADGSSVEASRDYPRGDPLAPLSDAELEAKLRHYFPADGPGRVDDIIRRLWSIENEKSLEWLIAPLKKRRIPEGHDR